MDVANRILDAAGVTTSPDTSSNPEILFVSTLSTTTAVPLEATNLLSIDVSANPESTEDAATLRDMSGGGDSNDPTIMTTESSSSPTPKSALSQVGNIIFQLLGEEGYNSFSCNLTTGSEDDTFNVNEGGTMYRRLNNANSTVQSEPTAVNGTLERIEFQPVDSNSLPKIPQGLKDDQAIKFLLLKFDIFDLCNFTSNDHQNWTESISKQLTLCSSAISTAKMHVDGKSKIMLEKYSQDIQIAVKKFRIIHESKMKIIKIINLTDYLTSTIKESEIPKDLKSSFHRLKQFLLVELKNEDLALFHPDSNRKYVFMVQLFDYLTQSKNVDTKMKKLLEIFKKFIRN